MAKSELIQPEFTGHKPNGYMNILDFFRNHVVEVKFKRRIYPTKTKGTSIVFESKQSLPSQLASEI